jgi:beta-galactosidase
VLALRGSRALFAVLLSVLILAVPKCFLGDSPDENPIATQLPGRDALLVGTDWYPQQWPESRWETDLRMMEPAHLQVVRLAEFAWSRLEPSEGQYDFAWLDRGIRLPEKHHLAVVLGTPTGGPPAWLTQKYPDTLRVEADGQRAGHGNRAHGSVTSMRYREYCRKIAEEMGKHYGHDADVVGWQIDNEYGYGQMSHDEDSQKQFQEWLKEKYNTLDSLNEHWATAYWSQTYDNWGEIPIR